MMRSAIQCFLLALSTLYVLLVAPPCLAQAGDREGHVMEDPPDWLQVPPAPPLSPQEALLSFQIEDGFEIQLVASEPLVEDPVCMAWDADGRLWVCEMRGYMPDLDATGEDQPTGMIVVLDDTDGDGVMDDRSVFLDGIVLPRAIAHVKGGILYADATSLYFIRFNPDGTAGPKVVIDPQYSDGGPKPSNVEHQANGLLFGLDNWLYNAKSDRRYRQVGSRFMRQPTEYRGQWGLTQDDEGNLLANNNSTFIEYELFPPGATLRNPSFNFNAGNVRSQRGIVRVSPATYPIRVTPGVNRGYQEGVVDHETWKLKSTTAACGPVIYRGGQFPENYYNNVFIPEPAGNLLKRIILERDGEGRPVARQAYDGREFLASTDERCRFVNAYTGPDGCLYLVDMYRGLFQHKSYVTSYLRRQVLARGLEKPLGMGRIYRVVYKDRPVDHDKPMLSAKTSEELVGYLGHTNAWHRETAQRLLVERRDDASVRPLELAAISSDNPQTRIHALWTLSGMGRLDPAVLETAGTFNDPRVWVQVMRLSEQFEQTPDAPRFVALMQQYSESPDWSVDLQLAFSAGVLAGLDTPGAYDVLLGVLERRGGDPLFRHAVISGLRGKEAVMLSRVDGGPIADELTGALVKATERGELTIGSLLALVDSDLFAADADRRLTMLAKLGAQAVEQGRDDVVGRLIDRMAAENAAEAEQSAILRGMVDGRALRSNPVELDGRPALFEAWMDDPPAALADLVAKLPEVFVFEKRIIGDVLAGRLKRGEELYIAHCAQCHGEQGEGRFSQGPPLAGSEWVHGNQRMVASLILNGVEGDIMVGGKLYTTPEIQSAMPGFKLERTDEELADVLTYVRNSFGNRADPIEVQVLADMRAATASRDRPYSPTQLLAIQPMAGEQVAVDVAAAASGPAYDLAEQRWYKHRMFWLLITLTAVGVPLLVLLGLTIFAGGPIGA